MKYVNWFTSLFAVVGGALCKFFGGWDLLLKVLIVLVVVDYITGIIKSIINKNLSSAVGGKGIAKKVMLLAIVGVANLIQLAIGGTVPLREIVILFFIANEGISVIENGAEIGVPIPKKLIDVLEQIRNGSDKGSDDNEQGHK